MTFIAPSAIIMLTIQNFAHCFEVCLIFYTYDSANFKSIGNNTMKKMPTRYRLALLLQGCTQQMDMPVSKQTGSSSTKEETILRILRFWNWAEENCRCNKFVAENVVKTKPTTFVNGLLSFIN